MTEKKVLDKSVVICYTIITGRGETHEGKDKDNPH